MRFTFLHAADLHIDSPLASLGAKDPAVAARFARARRDGGRGAGPRDDRQRGEIPDHRRRHLRRRLAATSRPACSSSAQLGELHRAGIPTFIIKGNHDADSVMSRVAALSRQRPRLRRRKAETQDARGAARRAARPQLRRARRGRRFRRELSRAPRGLAQYRRAAHQPRRRARPRHLRALHGRRPQALRLRLLGARPHPRRRDRLRAIPGSSIPATCRAAARARPAPKGAVRVTVDDGRIVAVEPVALDARALGA